MKTTIPFAVCLLNRCRQTKAKTSCLRVTLKKWEKNIFVKWTIFQQLNFIRLDIMVQEHPLQKSLLTSSNQRQFVFVAVLGAVNTQQLQQTSFQRKNLSQMLECGQTRFMWRPCALITKTMSLLLSMETLSICQQEADIMSNAQTTAFFLRIVNGLRRVAEFGPKHNLWRKKTPSRCFYFSFSWLWGFSAGWISELWFLNFRSDTKSPIVKQIAPIMIPMTPFHLSAWEELKEVRAICVKSMRKCELFLFWSLFWRI